MFKLPEITKIIPELPHFPTRWQAVLFRASEFFTAERIARVLRTTAENIRQAQEDMGLPTQEPSELWISRGYVSIIRNLWHLLPYSQLCEFLETDEGRLAALLREEDFLDIKLHVKPDCEAVYYRELTGEEKKRTQEIKREPKILLAKPNKRQKKKRLKPLPSKLKILKIKTSKGQFYERNLLRT